MKIAKEKQSQKENEIKLKEEKRKRREQKKENAKKQLTAKEQIKEKKQLKGKEVSEKSKRQGRKRKPVQESEQSTFFNKMRNVFVRHARKFIPILR